MFASMIRRRELSIRTRDDSDGVLSFRISRNEGNA